MDSSVTVVGPGRMGLALGAALLRTGAAERLTVFGRRPEPPSHPLFSEDAARYVFGVEPLSGDTTALFLAVPDEVVPEMAHTLAAQGPAPERCVAFHLSGSLSTDVLAPLHARGYAVGAFHPLQVASRSAASADWIAGSYVAVTGSPEATAVARLLASAMDCRLIMVAATRRPLLHAAAALTSSYVPPLLDAAVGVMERAGVDRDEALAALIALMRGTLSLVEEGGPAGAVAGPVAEGDVEAVTLHLRALEPEERRLYALLGRELMGLVRPGLRDDAEQELTSAFERAARE